MNNIFTILPIFIIFAVIYFIYQKNSGGHSYGTMGWALGLPKDQVYKKHYLGANYAGKLVPGSEPGLAHKAVVQTAAIAVGGLVKWTTRQTNWIFTDKNDLVITEARDGGLTPEIIFWFKNDEPKPLITYAKNETSQPEGEDFENGPKVATGFLKEVATKLLVIQVQNSTEKVYMWCDPAGIEEIINWSQTK